VPARHFDSYLEKALTVAFLTNLRLVVDDKIPNFTSFWFLYTVGWALYLSSPP
jgi:hypothetical protein